MTTMNTENSSQEPKEALKDIETLMSQAIQHMEKKKWKAAAITWNSILKMNSPETPKGVYVRLANTYRHLKRQKDVYPLLKKAIVNDDASAALYRETSLALFETGHKEAAMTVAVSSTLHFEYHNDKEAAKAFLYELTERLIG